MVLASTLWFSTYGRKPNNNTTHVGLFETRQ
ncbi:hypothetical protein MICRO8M_80012 [Microbacterium sp. 8M]|nr:hypothetical protein MICRO8M_80012 [Microbacterium sp. 8M]